MLKYHWVLAVILVTCVLTSGCRSYDSDLKHSEEMILAMPEQEGFLALFDEPWRKSIESHQEVRAELFTRHFSRMTKWGNKFVNKIGFSELSHVVEKMREAAEWDGKYLEGAKEFYSDEFSKHPRVQKVSRHLEFLYLLSYRALWVTLDLEEGSMDHKEAEKIRLKIQENLFVISKQLYARGLAPATPEMSKAFNRIETGLGSEISYLQITYRSLAKAKKFHLEPRQLESSSPECELQGYGEYRGSKYLYRIRVNGKVIDGSDQFDSISTQLATLVDKKMCQPPVPRFCAYLGVGDYGDDEDTDAHAFPRLRLGDSILALGLNLTNKKYQSGFKNVAFGEARARLESLGVCAPQTSIPTCSLLGKNQYHRDGRDDLNFRILLNDSLVGDNDEADSLVNHFNWLFSQKLCVPPMYSCSILGRDPGEKNPEVKNYLLQVGSARISSSSVGDLINTQTKLEKIGVCALFPNSPDLPPL